jgi:hypothetical protein
MTTWTYGRILEAIQARSAQLGCTPPASDFMAVRGSDRPSHATIRKFFGSYNCAVTVLGLTPNLRGGQPAGFGAVCRHGHPLTAENVYIIRRRGVHGYVQRVCRTCRRPKFRLSVRRRANELRQFWQVAS